MTTTHTRQLQQYTQDNYNNKHKTTTTIHTRQLRTIRTRHLKIQRVQKLNNTKESKQKKNYTRKQFWLSRPNITYLCHTTPQIWPYPAATPDLTPADTPHTTPAAIYDITPASYIGCQGLYLGTNATSFVQNKWGSMDSAHLSIVVGKHIPSNGER